MHDMHYSSYYHECKRETAPVPLVSRPRPMARGLHLIDENGKRCRSQGIDEEIKGINMMDDKPKLGTGRKA